MRCGTGVNQSSDLEETLAVVEKYLKMGHPVNIEVVDFGEQTEEHDALEYEVYVNFLALRGHIYCVRHDANLIEHEGCPQCNKEVDICLQTSPELAEALERHVTKVTETTYALVDSNGGVMKQGFKSETEAVGWRDCMASEYLAAEDWTVAVLDKEVD